MELVEKYPVTRAASARRWTIQEAAEKQLQGWGRAGTVEQLQNEVETMRTHMALLIAHLAAAGTITEEQVLAMLPSFEKAP